MLPKVSIIIPVYNHAAFLERCVQSALCQTYRNIEVILVNDASTDRSAEIAKDFLRKDSRVRYLEHPVNLGVSLADTTGCNAARGKYIAILDADTFFHPEKVEKQVAYLNAHPDLAAVFSLCNLVDSSGAPFEDEADPYASVFLNLNQSQSEWLRYFFYQGNCLCHSSMLMQKKYYRKVKRYTPGIAQLGDLDLYIRLLQYANIHIMGEPLLDTTINGANMSTLSDASHTRLQAEYTALMRTYETLPSSLFAQVFPEYATYAHSAALRRYHMAMAALQSVQHGKRVWGIRLLEKLINRPASGKLLLERFGFGPQQFYRLRTDINPYPLYRHNSYLNVDIGEGYPKDHAFFSSVPKQDSAFTLRFDQLADRENVRSLQWIVAQDVPCPLGLTDLVIQWEDSDGTLHDASWGFAHNGYMENGVLRLPPLAPIIELWAPGAVLLKISGKIRYFYSVT